MSEQDAITRRVPEAEIFASLDNGPDRRRRFFNGKILLSVGALAVVVSVVVMALVMKRRSSAPVAPVSTVDTQGPEKSAHPRPSAGQIETTPVPSPRIKAEPESIHLEITSDPNEAELGLDGNIVAGHRLSLDVPGDRGIHVVSASAPGYLPFNQQVRFSSDIVLKISLHRARTLPVHQGAKPRPSQLESSPKINVRPTTVSSGPRLAPGMSLDGPAVRSSAKSIDERNPYKP